MLALQGAVQLHLDMLRELGVTPIAVRRPAELDEVDALVVPGGESTTMLRLIELNGLFEPLAERLDEDMPALGTCAGMIVLGAGVYDGRDDQRSFGAIDASVRRNAFGRQVDSFETDLVIEGIAEDPPFHAVFIRAPVVEVVASPVEVLASVDGNPVCCRQGDVMVTAFHPELSGDTRIHRAFLERVAVRTP